jgi:NAD-dependent deacetylase
MSRVNDETTIGPAGTGSPPAGAEPAGQADDALVERVRGWVEEAAHVVVLTGAGISTDSGIPDFRGPKGVWTRNPEAEKRATLQHYMSDPAIRRKAWLDRLDHQAWVAEPNDGHRALVALERRGKLDTLITQNVDGLHQAAGNDPERVVEVHGTIRRVMCMSCDERTPMRDALDRVRAGEVDPPCRTCGGILKSATISFGQNLVPADLERAGAAARRADLLLAVGSTLAVYPVADVVPVARLSGARVVIVNGSPTEMDHLADAVLRGQISGLLPRIVGR